MRQEDVMHVLHEPLAQELMRSEIPARLAYTGSDGFPRVVPVGFLWNGAQFVIGTAPIAPKVRALARNPKVALTIDTNTWLPHVLLVRGTASIEVVDGVAPEYLNASRKYIPAEQWEAFEAQARALYKQQARITIVPEGQSCWTLRRGRRGSSQSWRLAQEAAAEILTRRCRALFQRGQRLGEVGDDVGRVFDAGGEAYQPRADS